MFSLLGIDATTTLQVSDTRIEFERGSLSGFVRRLTPFGHISSSYYGSHKPWKTALGILSLCLFIGSAIQSGWAFLLFLLIGVVGGGLYYFLNKELMIGFNEDSGASAVITFKRSVIEGQEIDEEQLKKIIIVIENLIKKQAGDIAHIDIGGAPSNARAAGAAPTTFKEVMQGPVTPPPAPKPAAQATTCPKCANPITPDDVFCGGCGHKLK